MKMKLNLAALVVMGLGVNGMCLAQEKPEQGQLRVKQHTLMARFEPGYVPPAEKRLELKVARKETVAYRSALIDTLDIPERKKRRLRKELYNTPFTDEWEKVVDDLDFGEEIQEDPEP